MFSNQTIHIIGVVLLLSTILTLMGVAVREMFDDKVQ